MNLESSAYRLFNWVRCSCNEQRQRRKEDQGQNLGSQTFSSQWEDMAHNLCPFLSPFLHSAVRNKDVVDTIRDLRQGPHSRDGRTVTCYVGVCVFQLNLILKVIQEQNWENPGKIDQSKRKREVAQITSVRFEEWDYRTTAVTEI